MNEFDKVYLDGLNKILNEGVYEYNKKKGLYTKRLFDLNIRLNDVNYVPLLNIRKINPRVVLSEIAWFLQGTQSTDFVNEYSKIWKGFEDEPGIVNNAYGHRWRKHFGRDQVMEYINMFKKDNASRHGVISTWDPSMDGLLRTGEYKNTPCPHTFTGNIMNNKLNMSVHQRSADYMIGTPHDFAGFTLLNMAFAKSIGVNPGTISFNLVDAHIYDNHLNQAKELSKNYNNQLEITPRFSSPSIESIIKNPHGYVSNGLEQISSYYNPTRTIKGLKVNK